MYRFANAAMTSDFAGSEPIKKFLTELYANATVPDFKSAYHFINDITDKLRDYLSAQKIFVDTFTIKRDDANVYCLFFFTSHVKGFETMLEAKWKLDSDQGKGFTYERRPSLFAATELSGYPYKLREYLESGEYRSNEDVRIFGLHQGFLPKHTNTIFKDWIENDEAFDIISLDGKTLRRKVTYVSNQQRSVAYRLKSSSRGPNYG